MCEYCGCKEVPAITQLHDHHRDLLDQGDRVQRALAEVTATTRAMLYPVSSSAVGSTRPRTTRRIVGDGAT